MIESTTVRAAFGATRRWRLLLVALALLLPTASLAETFNCTEITTLPTTISTPGTYCLNKNFSQNFGSQVAIYVATDDVVLDCNGHTVRDTATASDSDGIYAWADRNRVVIRNCVFDNFYYGIDFVSNTAGARNNVIQDNSIVRARAAGIYVWGSGNLIEGNNVTELQGLGSTNPTGIFVSSPDNLGSGNVIRGNLIANFKPSAAGTLNTIGIMLSGLQNTEVSDNNITGLNAYTGQSVFGIYSNLSTGLSVTDNVIASPPTPYVAPDDGSSAYGVYVGGTSAQQATTVCSDNQVGHFNTDIYGCNKAGNTEF